MDNLHLHKEVSALKKLGQEYEQQLKLLGFDLSHLPYDILGLLNEYAEIKLKTKLHDLDKSYLEELYYNERREQIENAVIIQKFENDIRNLEKDIETENIEIKKLQNFSSAMNLRIGSTTGMEKNETEIELKIEGMQNMQNNLSIPKDINIDDLISKVEILEKRKNSKQ